MSLHVEAGIEVATEIAGLRDDLRSRHRELDWRAKALEAVDATAQTVGTCPTPTASFCLNLGGPDAGYWWMVHRVLVGGLTWTTPAAGAGELYVTGFNPPSGSTGGPAAARTLTDMVDHAASLPLIAFYGHHELVIQPNQTLIMVITSGTAGQQYSAAMGYQVFRQAASVEEHQ